MRAVTVADNSGDARVKYIEYNETNATATWKPEAPITAATDPVYDAKGDLVGGTGADTAAALTVGADGQRIVAASGETTGMEWADETDALMVTFDSPAASDHLDLIVPFDCTIDSVTMLPDVSGSIVVDIWKDTYANYPPTDADTITASAVPSISSATKSQDTTLTGWTRALTKGEVLRFDVDSVATIARCLVGLGVTRT